MNNSSDELPVIDYEQTLAASKIVYTGNNNMMFGYLLLLCPIVLLTGWFAYDLIGAFSSGFNAFVIVIFLADIFFILNLLLVNSIVKAEGKEMLRNREDVLNVLHHFYDDLNFSLSERNLVRAVKLSKEFSPGRVVTIIFKENTVFFHIATLGRKNAIAPIYSFTNYLRCIRIAREFRNVQANRQYYKFDKYDF